MGKKESETEKVTQETVEVEALKFQLEAKSESGAEGTVSFTEESRYFHTDGVETYTAVENSA